MPLENNLKKIASQTEIWDALAQSGATVHTAMRQMNVSLSTAKEGLAEACARLRRRHENCVAAETILEASGLVKQSISRRAWDEVALGLRSA